MRVRTGRFTNRKHTPHSGVSVRFHPKRTHTDQALVLQPLVGHPGLGRQRLRHPPVALAADGRQNRVAFTHAEGKQTPHLRTHQTPLFPVAHTHTSAQPLVDLGYRHTRRSPGAARQLLTFFARPKKVSKEKPPQVRRVLTAVALRYSATHMGCANGGVADFEGLRCGGEALVRHPSPRPPAARVPTNAVQSPLLNRRVTQTHRGPSARTV